MHESIVFCSVYDVDVKKVHVRYLCPMLYAIAMEQIIICHI